MTTEPRRSSPRVEFRVIDGVLLLDKSTGFSSNASLQKARRLLRARKAGHTGSLDPLASGLLPVCLGDATKFSGHLLNTDKRYSVRIRLGSETDTADSEGAVTGIWPVPHLTIPQLETTLQAFRGEGVQVPPMYSALKHQGQRLYDLARKGVEVPREARPITIHELRLEALHDGVIDLDVHCSKGTYIRVLAEDIGRALGCGGHVEILRRTAVGHLTVCDALTLDELEQMSEADRCTRLLSADAMLTELPALRLESEAATRIRHGVRVTVSVPGIPGSVRLYGPQNDFMGLGELSENGMLIPRRLVSQSV